MTTGTFKIEIDAKEKTTRDLCLVYDPRTHSVGLKPRGSLKIISNNNAYYLIYNLFAIALRIDVDTTICCLVEALRSPYVAGLFADLHAVFVSQGSCRRWFEIGDAWKIAGLIIDAINDLPVRTDPGEILDYDSAKAIVAEARKTDRDIREVAAELVSTTLAAGSIIDYADTVHYLYDAENHRPYVR